jgi:hypothetical protein
VAAGYVCNVISLRAELHATKPRAPQGKRFFLAGDSTAPTNCALPDGVYVVLKVVLSSD